MGLCGFGTNLFARDVTEEVVRAMVKERFQTLPPALKPEFVMMAFNWQAHPARITDEYKKQQVQHWLSTVQADECDSPPKKRQRLE